MRWEVQRCWVLPGLLAPLSHPAYHLAHPTLDQTYTDGHKKGTRDSGLGDYTVQDNNFTRYWSHEPGQNVETTFIILPDGSLKFTDVNSHEGGDWALMAEVHFDRWKRVGA